MTSTAYQFRMIITNVSMYLPLIQIGPLSSKRHVIDSAQIRSGFNPSTEIATPLSESGGKCVRNTKGSLEALTAVLKSVQKVHSSYKNCIRTGTQKSHTVSANLLSQLLAVKGYTVSERWKVFTILKKKSDYVGVFMPGGIEHLKPKPVCFFSFAMELWGWCN